MNRLFTTNPPDVVRLAVNKYAHILIQNITDNRLLFRVTLPESNDYIAMPTYGMINPREVKKLKLYSINPTLQPSSSLVIECVVSNPAFIELLPEGNPLFWREINNTSQVIKHTSKLLIHMTSYETSSQGSASRSLRRQEMSPYRCIHFLSQLVQPIVQRSSSIREPVPIKPREQEESYMNQVEQYRKQQRELNTSQSTSVLKAEERRSSQSKVYQFDQPLTNSIQDQPYQYKQANGYKKNNLQLTQIQDDAPNSQPISNPQSTIQKPAQQQQPQPYNQQSFNMDDYDIQERELISQIEHLKDEHQSLITQLNKLNFLEQFNDQDAPIAKKHKILFWHLMLISVLALIIGAFVKKTM